MEVYYYKVLDSTKGIKLQEGLVNSQLDNIKFNNLIISNFNVPSGITLTEYRHLFFNTFKEAGLRIEYYVSNLEEYILEHYKVMS